jgi:hypothetical protein
MFFFALMSVAVDPPPIPNSDLILAFIVEVVSEASRQRVPILIQTTLGISEIFSMLKFVFLYKLFVRFHTFCKIIILLDTIQTHLFPLIEELTLNLSSLANS